MFDRLHKNDFLKPLESLVRWVPGNGTSLYIPIRGRAAGQGTVFFFYFGLFGPNRVYNLT